MKYWKLFLLVVPVLTSSVSAQVLFEDDFETGDFAAGPSNQWSWSAQPTSNNLDSAMMRGINDVYSVTQERVYRGSYALRLNFEGRNGFCNICGATSATLNSTTASTGCFSGAQDGPFAGYVYNKSNGFTRWNVTGGSGRQVCVNTADASGDSIIPGVSPSLNAGDEVIIPFRCGVNGTVGNEVGRRSDCNRAINYLEGVDRADITYGETVSRRMYVYLPSQSSLPDVTFKLGYAAFQRQGRTPLNSKLKLSVQRDLQLVLDAPSGEDIVEQEYAERDTWMYFEELFTRESGPGRSDGAYRVYMGRADAPVSELTRPVVTRSNIEVGELVRFSIHGNWQHYSNVSGYAYFDDIVVSKNYVGPVGYDPDQPPPKPIADLN